MAEAQPQLAIPLAPATETGPAHLDVPAPRRSLEAHPYASFKPLVEIPLALILLLVSMPFLLLAAFLIKVTSPGPAIYAQVRVGRNGRLYTIYKLRTMHASAEAASGPVWSSPGDPRITPLGHWLRASHLDEFPQLINVILGQMSLAGPRPERPEIVNYLKARIDGYTDRLAVLPGITGLAQVQLPPDVDLDGVRKKLVCDLHYIEHLNAWTDLRILVCTGLFMFGVPLRFSRRRLRIPEPLEAAPKSKP